MFICRSKLCAILLIFSCALYDETYCVLHNPFCSCNLHTLQIMYYVIKYILVIWKAWPHFIYIMLYLHSLYTSHCPPEPYEVITARLLICICWVGWYNDQLSSSLWFSINPLPTFTLPFDHVNQNSWGYRQNKRSLTARPSGLFWYKTPSLTWRMTIFAPFSSPMTTLWKG